MLNLIASKPTSIFSAIAVIFATSLISFGVVEAQTFRLSPSKFDLNFTSTQKTTLQVEINNPYDKDLEFTLSLAGSVRQEIKKYGIEMSVDGERFIADGTNEIKVSVPAGVVKKLNIVVAPGQELDYKTQIKLDLKQTSQLIKLSQSDYSIEININSQIASEKKNNLIFAAVLAIVVLGVGSLAGIIFWKS